MPEPAWGRAQRTGDFAVRYSRDPITLSLFDLLKAGPGPSSSHTIGPMAAGADFARKTAALAPEIQAGAGGVRVRLFGSLSATGKGHGTGPAVVSGLAGCAPDACAPALLQRAADPDALMFLTLPQGRNISIGPQIIEYGPVRHKHPFNNTLIIELLDAPYPLRRNGQDASAQPAGRTDCRSLPRDESGRSPAGAGNVLFSAEYYSTGGGFIRRKGAKREKRCRPPHPYADMKEFRARCAESGLGLDELLMENETALTGKRPADVTAELDKMLAIMRDTVLRGCSASGALPGNIGLRRKAAVLHERARSLAPFDRALCLFNAYAYAAAEENAAGGLVVTAPTCGASGVVPAVLMFMEEQLGLDLKARRRGLAAAALIGFIAKHNAGIAGAEVGCQGEIGVASAMAAAMLAHARGFSVQVVENAAEIALEHHLGLTCDPVGGYVQIPCIERNAVGAVTAYNAALIACNENPASHKVSYDEVLRAMSEIGRDMNAKYKETAAGGLAVCLVEC
ncbi:MAG: L-serine ammonia-lyase, iron-sulfur-dependent, subunit alpha [Desulfovibrio sp.]|nr:L-serine ammonia-lyase, iron-sulfur-dependent, subunit alpha [Desulfovibrio sp.]